MSLTIERPWGKFERFTINQKSTVKLLYVKGGHRNSYAYHKKRSEFWKVVRGKIRATVNGRIVILKEGDSIFVPMGGKHRFEGIVDSVILEIDKGIFSEADTVRLEDDYGRARKRA